MAAVVANLTNDDTGLKNFTSITIKDKTGATVKSYQTKKSGAGFTFDLNQDLTVRGLKGENELRLTVDLPDGTRSAVIMHRLSGSS